MITSSNNPTIKNLIQLQKKSKTRKEQACFIVEGIKLFSEIPRERLLKTYVSEEFLREESHTQLIHDVNYDIVSDKIFKEISDTKTPQGILALVKQSNYSLEEILEQDKLTHLLVLEDIQDPGNLGTMIRSGEGAGVTGFVMSKGTVDIYNPKVIRSTMGSIYRMPFVYVEDLKEAIVTIKETCKVFGTHLSGEKMYDKGDYTKDIALLVGNEANGLSEMTAKLADELIKIPMEGQVESLNAAVASSILMYEVYRQRR